MKKKMHILEYSCDKSKGISPIYGGNCFANSSVNFSFTLTKDDSIIAWDLHLTLYVDTFLVPSIFLSPSLTCKIIYEKYNFFSVNVFIGYTSLEHEQI